MLERWTGPVDADCPAGAAGSEMGVALEEEKGDIGFLEGVC